MSFTIGRFNVPAILLVGFMAYFVVSIFSLIFIKDKEERKGILNIISNSLVIGVLTWKLSPLLTSFSEVIKAPISIVYLNGGTVGVLLGLLAAIIFLAVKYYRLREKPLLVVSSSYIGLAVIFYLIMALVHPKAMDAEFIAEVNGIEGIDLYQNDLTIINFWATWCSPCKAELPELTNFYNKYGDDVSFYGVNLTNTEKGDISDFITSHEITFPIIYDNDGSLSNLFEVKTIPTTVIIQNIDGELFMQSIGGAITETLLIGYMK